MLSDAPQPIAEAIVSLDGARNSHQARDALWEAVHVIVRYLGLLALACRSRIGAGTSTDSAAITEGLRALRRRDLSDQEWFALTCALVRPFENQKDAYPIPELVALGTTATLSAPFERLIAERIEATTATSDGDVRDLVRAAVSPDVAGALQAAAFVFDYRLVVPRSPELAELWMGSPRRMKRGTVPIQAARAIAQDQPILDSWAPGARAPALAVAARAGRRPLPRSPRRAVLLRRSRPAWRPPDRHAARLRAPRATTTGPGCAPTPSAAPPRPATRTRAPPAKIRRTAGSARSRAADAAPVLQAASTRSKPS